MFREESVISFGKLRICAGQLQRLNTRNERLWNGHFWRREAAIRQQSIFSGR